jgi:hypothetical protein
MTKDTWHYSDLCACQPLQNNECGLWKKDTNECTQMPSLVTSGMEQTGMTWTQQDRLAKHPHHHGNLSIHHAPQPAVQLIHPLVQNFVRNPKNANTRRDSVHREAYWEVCGS